MLPVVVSLAVALATLGPVDDAIERAGAQAGEGDVEGAIETIRDARREHDDRDLLYVEAQLHRLRDSCEDAVPLYEAFQATDPPPEDRAEVDAKLAQCREELGVEPEPPPPQVAEPPPPVLVESPPAPEPVDPAPSAQGPDRVGLALWISGGVLLAGGAAAYGAAWGLRSSADDGSPTLDTYLDREQRARTVSGVGIAVASAGTAVLIGAAIRHVLRNR
ncbi:MAG: hypothetical protein ACE37F_23245 [Nannocystaceae bacterium]|nr:hypothetical protein [bacterium]